MEDRAIYKGILMLYLLSVRYNGKDRKAHLIFYDDLSQKIKDIPDYTNHKPYLLTDYSPDEIIEKFPDVLKHKGFDYLEVVERYDALNDRWILMTKIVALDPLSVGGSRRSLRDILKGHAWEAKIKYHHNYIYDNGLIPGMPYRLENGKPIPVDVELSPDMREKITSIYKEKDLAQEALQWAKLFEAPIPKLKRIAIDIEVESLVDLVPNPKEAAYPVIAVSYYSSDGKRGVYLLKRREETKKITLKDAEITFFEDEKELLKKTFELIREYPLVITFNGDHFDMPYLYNRALRLGFREEEIPIEWSPRMEEARVIPGIHLDLYKFFTNRSMRVYAFSNKYREGRTLDEIATALLGEGKVEHEEPISEMTYEKLAEYSFRDAEITYRLTSFNDDLVMKLIILMMRISKLPLDDLTRHNISAWIKNLFYYEHRRRGWLIPNPEDIKSMKGQTVTKAIIKGKKYMGAIVIDPVPGVYFNVVVVDFASLYPSVIKTWNLSYETVRCPHPECQDNKIPGTPHWVCKKKRGMMSTVVGILRDLRVYLYKPLAKKAEDLMLREQYKVVQAALKVFINASYGVFGAETFPLYCPPVAESTTALGRYSILKTMEMALEMKLPVLYGDTDSLFLWNPTEDQVNELIKRSLEELQIDLGIDKVYKWVVFSKRKKNYLGILVDGKPDIKGLTGKKRNTPEFIKQLFYKIVEILSDAEDMESFENSIEEIKDAVRKTYVDLKKKNISLDQLAFRVALTKPLHEYTKTTPQHIKAARQLLRYKKTIDVGEIISYIKTRDKTGVKPVQLARIDEVDTEKYLEALRTTLEQVLDALDISFDEIMGAHSLEGYFGQKKKEITHPMLPK